MEKVILAKENLMPIRMNRASVTLKLGDIHVYCSRRVYNELLKDQFIPTYITTSDMGEKWLSIPSRF